MDARTWTLALNTLWLTSATCAVSLPVGSVVAWLVTRTDMPGRRGVAWALLVMLFVPLYLQAAAWEAGFGVQGWFTQCFGMPGWLDGFWGAVWVHCVAAIPWVVLIVGAALRLIEPGLEEQALLDATPWQVVMQVTLRGALPGVAVAAMWIAIVTGGEMTVTDLFSVRTYAEEIYTQFALGNEPGEALLGVGPGVAFSVAMVLLGVLLCGRLAPRGQRAGFRRQHVFTLGRWQIPFAIAAGLFALLIVGIPLINLINKAGVLVTQIDNQYVRSWSPTKCVNIIATSPWRYRREFGWSLGIGALAATAAVATAVAMAWPARHRRRWAVTAIAISAICLALPGPVVGIGLIGLLNRPEVPGLVFLYDQSILAPWLALTIRSLPAPVLILWHAFRTIPQELLDSAAIDGAGPMRRLVLVALPLRCRSLFLAWIVGMAVALGDLAASVLVVPPGVTTLSIQVFGLLHSGVQDRVAGICLATVALFAATTAVVAVPLLRRTRI